MMDIAINQQVTMKANYLRSQLMTSQGQPWNCNAGLQISDVELPRKGAQPEICNAHVFSGVLYAYAQSFCADWVHKRPAGNREVYMI
jgi:hypothetical protein